MIQWFLEEVAAVAMLLARGSRRRCVVVETRCREATGWGRGGASPNNVGGREGGAPVQGGSDAEQCGLGRLRRWDAGWSGHGEAAWQRGEDNSGGAGVA
jgi:hypothetical protein